MICYSRHLLLWLRLQFGLLVLSVSSLYLDLVSVFYICFSVNVVPAAPLFVGTTLAVVLLTVFVQVFL